MATYHELATIYSLEDEWNLLEILQVNKHNEYRLAEYSKKNERRRY